MSLIYEIAAQAAKRNRVAHRRKRAILCRKRQAAGTARRKVSGCHSAAASGKNRIQIWINTIMQIGLNLSDSRWE